MVTLGHSHYFIDFAFVFDWSGYNFLRQVAFVPVVDVEGMDFAGVHLLQFLILSKLKLPIDVNQLVDVFAIYCFHSNHIYQLST